MMTKRYFVATLKTINVLSKKKTKRLNTQIENHASKADDKQRKKNIENCIDAAAIT